jgi:hypothetical protein
MRREPLPFSSRATEVRTTGAKTNRTKVTLLVRFAVAKPLDPQLRIVPQNPGVVKSHLRCKPAAVGVKRVEEAESGRLEEMH